MSTPSKTLETDDFNRADETPLAAPWIDIRSGASSFNLASNVVAVVTPTLDTEYGLRRRNLPSDQYVQAAITVAGTNAASGVGVLLRASGVAGVRTFYRVYVSKAASNNVTIDRFNAGANTNLATRTTTWVDGDVLRVEITGTGTATIKVFQNDSQLGADISDGTAIDSGIGGICISSTITSGSIDNFEEGDFSGAVPERILPFLRT